MIDPNDKNLPKVDVEDKNASEHVKMSRRLFLGGYKAMGGSVGAICAIGAGLGSMMS